MASALSWESVPGRARFLASRIRLRARRLVSDEPLKGPVVAERRPLIVRAVLAVAVSALGLAVDAPFPVVNVMSATTTATLLL